MKNLLLSLFFVLNSFFAISQSLVVTGDTVVYGSIDDFGIEAHMIVKNVSANTLNILCAKNVISEPTTGSNDFCWGGTCYGAGTMISTKMDTLDAGEETNGFTGYFHSFIPGPASPGTAVVEYCFYPESNTLDQTCLTVTYHATETTSHNFAVLDSDIKFYPNPSSEYTTVKFAMKSRGTLELTDILGNVVKKINFEGHGEKTIFLGDLNKGIYFGNLYEDGKIISIEKLIINN